MSRTIKKFVEVEITPSATELAEAFWHMGEDEQCRFFHRITEVAGARLDFQLRAVIDSPHMTAAARNAMQTIGDYGYAEPRTKQ